MSRFDEEPPSPEHAECAAEIRALVKQNDALEDRLTQTWGCAYCDGLPFCGYGPDAVDRGLCCKHAQSLAVDIGQLKAMLKRAVESLKNAMDYLKDEGYK